MKCDETRPCCRKCTESGRKCEGPVVGQLRFIDDGPISEPVAPLPQLDVSLLAPQHSEDERRAFHYFTHAPVFAVALDAAFWKDLVPRLAHSYDFVWDTVVCIGSLLEHAPYTSLPTTTDSTSLTKITNQEHRQALRYYHRAIVNVRELAECGQVDDSVVILSYILFASVEFHHRNVRTGTNLLKRCCKVLTQNLTSLYSKQNSTASQAILQVVAPFILRRAVVIATLGNALPPHWIADNEFGKIPKAVISRSPTLNEAKVQFHILVCHCYEVIRHADFIPDLDKDDPGKVLFLSYRQSLFDRLMQWKAAFTATRSRTFDVKTDWIGSYLLMYWAVCYISLETCLKLRQTSFDNYIDHFADIVEHATIYLRQSARPTKVQLLSTSDPGVIPPLYFCATKCRDPILRREALRLMRQAPPQENFWALVASHRVVAKIIAVEEGENQLSFSKDSPRSQHANFPPEERRLAHVSVIGRQALGGKQRQLLEMSRFEFSINGSKRLINEYTMLNDEP